MGKQLITTQGLFLFSSLVAETTVLFCLNFLSFSKKRSPAIFTIRNIYTLSLKKGGDGEKGEKESRENKVIQSLTLHPTEKRSVQV